MTSGSLEAIRDFLAQKRIAMIGVSRQPHHFSRILFREFVRRGYDVVPVNPQAAEIEGRQCFARAQEISPAADCALVMTSAGASERIVRDCAEAGIRRIWLYRAVGRGAVTREAVELGKAHGLEIVAGFCPFMFFPQANWFHRLHGLLVKLTGGYPVRSSEI